MNITRSSPCAPVSANPPCATHRRAWSLGRTGGQEVSHSWALHIYPLQLPTLICLRNTGSHKCSHTFQLQPAGKWVRGNDLIKSTLESASHTCTHGAWAIEAYDFVVCRLTWDLCLLQNVRMHHKDQRVHSCQNDRAILAIHESKRRDNGLGT